jgi:hypothetical protein
LGVLAWFAVFGFAGPFVGGEDDGEEAVGLRHHAGNPAYLLTTAGIT